MTFDKPNVFDILLKTERDLKMIILNFIKYICQSATVNAQIKIILSRLR